MAEVLPKSDAVLRRIKWLHLDLAEFDLTHKVQNGYYRRMIPGACASVFVRVLTDETLISEKCMRASDKDDKDSIAKVCDSASVIRL